MRKNALPFTHIPETMRKLSRRTSRFEDRRSISLLHPLANKMEYLKKALPPSDADRFHIQETVSGILADVERDGTDAIRRYSTKFDGWNPPSFRVSPNQIRQAEERVDPKVKEQIEFSRSQVERFAGLQRASLIDFQVETLPGVTLGQKQIPVNSVGSYVPGGTYPLIASALMTIVVPKVAGVPRVVAVAPPQKGTMAINPVQLLAMAKSGADEILVLGGVQAFCALAFGLEDSPPLDPVDMIVGPGNAYVAEAKRQLYGRVGIDLQAGPTEILVLADASADPRLVAADLLGQAEHGTTSPAIVVTDSREQGEAIIREVENLLKWWPTAAVAGAAWRNRGEVIVCADIEEMARIADQIASEHVEVQTADPKWFLDRLTNYGSLFLGANATVVYGDKGIGTNHVLPTGRAARYTGGLWVGKFLKTVTWQTVTDAGNAEVAATMAAIAEAENMKGHALTARMRIESEKDSLFNGR
jgi:sulfopropanediol 3-dehydrogenase